MDYSKPYADLGCSPLIQTSELVSGGVQFNQNTLTKTEIDNPEALSKYYRLLLSIVRVITSIVLSRGSQNEQTIESAKVFLTENRPLVVSMFKRQARIGGVSFDDAGVDIEELVELVMLLIEMTGFVDVGFAGTFILKRTEADSIFSLKCNEIPYSRGGQPSPDVHLRHDAGKGRGCRRLR